MASPLDRALAALSDLGPWIRRGEMPALPAPRLTSDLPALDALTGGGLPRGRVSELAGPDSSGRTALGLALLAATTRRSALAAWIDANDAFDPASATAAGADLARVLWVRAPGPRAALRAAERVLEARGFPLVVLDLPALAPAERARPLDPPDELARARVAPASTSSAAHARVATPSSPSRAAGPSRPPSVAAWTRLSRAAAGADAALLVLAPVRHGGVWVELGLELAPGAPRFTGSPQLLEERAVRALLARGRGAAVPGRAAALRLRAADAA